MGADPSLVRIIWVLAVFATGGLALVIYIVMAIIVPEGPAGLGTAGPNDPAAGDAQAARAAGMAPAASWGAPRRPATGAGRARAGLIPGLILIVVGAIFLAQQLMPALDLALWWPTVAIALGVLLVVLALIPSRSR
jgi:hypothetical protein